MRTINGVKSSHHNLKYGTEMIKSHLPFSFDIGMNEHWVHTFANGLEISAFDKKNPGSNQEVMEILIRNPTKNKVSIYFGEREGEFKIAANDEEMLIASFKNVDLFFKKIAEVKTSQTVEAKNITAMFQCIYNNNEIGFKKHYEQEINSEKEKTKKNSFMKENLIVQSMLYDFNNEILFDEIYQSIKKKNDLIKQKMKKVTLLAGDAEDLKSRSKNRKNATKNTQNGEIEPALKKAVESYQKAINSHQETVEFLKKIMWKTASTILFEYIFERDKKCALILKKEFENNPIFTDILNKMDAIILKSDYKNQKQKYIKTL